MVHTRRWTERRRRTFAVAVDAPRSSPIRITRLVALHLLDLRLDDRLHVASARWVVSSHGAHARSDLRRRIVDRVGVHVVVDVCGVREWALAGRTRPPRRPPRSTSASMRVELTLPRRPSSSSRVAEEHDRIALLPRSPRPRRRRGTGLADFRPLRARRSGRSWPRSASVPRRARRALDRRRWSPRRPRSTSWPSTITPGMP